MSEKTKSPLRFIIEDTHAIEIGLSVTGMLLILLSIIVVYNEAIEYRLKELYKFLISVPVTHYIFVTGVMLCFCGIIVYFLKKMKYR